MQYNDCLNRIYSSRGNGAVKKMHELCRLLGNPQEAVKAIHVAGTNGKGSVVTKIAAALQLEGYRVGLYTSPHISCFRERVRINGEKISEADVVLYLEKIFSFGIPATFFEHATLLAFAYFAAQKVDVAVLEAGIGGRLDATNVCSPILTVITSIGLDHTEVLGDTIEKIALEKAGIVKPNVPLVIGPHVPREIVASKAVELNAPFYAVDERSQHYEEENRSVAKKALAVLGKNVPLRQESIDQGLEALPSCRFHLIEEAALKERFGLSVPKAVILDVAHNIDGVKRLLERLKISVCKLPFSVVCGFSRDKDVRACLQKLMEEAQALFFVQAVSDRAMPVQELIEIAREIDAAKSCYAFSEIEEGIEKACFYAADQGNVLVVCGTFYIMNECRHFFGIEG